MKTMQNTTITPASWEAQFRFARRLRVCGPAREVSMAAIVAASDVRAGVWFAMADCSEASGFN